MKIEVFPVAGQELIDYSSIPIRFEVRTKLDIKIIDNGLRVISFSEQRVTPPYIKDYDQIKGEGPTRWPKRFNVTNWSLFITRAGELPVGGAIVAFRTPNLDILDGREDLSALWDLRIRPEYRRSGVGTELFKEVIRWSADNGCKQLKVETQNVNIPACKFYIKQGCKLGEFHRYKYVDNPMTANEVMLVWYLNLQ